jgi:hypothetical protein
MDDESPVPAPMYSAFVNMWIHQDRLMWSRVSWFLTTEVVTVAACFARPGPVGAAVVVFGTVILTLMWGMFVKDRRDQEEALKIIDRFHAESGFPFPKARIIAEPVKWWRSARNLLKLGLCGVLVVNLILLALHLLFALGGSLDWLFCPAASTV